MLLKSPFQTVINIVVIFLLVASLVMGIVLLVPSRNPAGPLLGKIISSKNNLPELLANLDPKELGQVLSENPEMMNLLLRELSKDDDEARIIAEAVNNNPEFISQLLDYLDVDTVAKIVNGAGDFTVRLMGALDPAAIAKVVNESGPWVSDLLGRLDPQVLAEVLNANGDFLTRATAATDPQVLAEAINNNGPFVTALIGYLDPAVLANALNANAALSSALMGYLDTAVVAQIVNSNQTFLTDIIGLLDPAVIAAGTNANPTFLSRLMQRLDPAVVAAAMNGNASRTTSMITHLSDYLLLRVLNVTANDAAWLTSLIAALDPLHLADITNTHPSFANRLIKYLDPQWVAGIANANPSLVYQVLDKIDPDLVADILNNQALLTRTMPYLNTTALAGALGQQATIISRLIPLLDPGIAEKAVASLNANPTFLDAFVAATNASVLAQALANSNGNLVRELLPHLSPQVAESIANALNADAGQAMDNSFIKSLIANSDPVVIAAAVNANPSFVGGLLETLNVEAALAIAQGMNASPSTAQEVAKGLNAATGQRIADALNNNSRIIEPLLSHLSADVGLALAKGLNQASPDFMQAMMSGLSPVVGEAIAAGLNSNTVLITTLLPELDGDTGRVIAEGLNESSTPPHQVGGEYFLEAMLKATTPGVAQAIAAAINTPPYNFDSFIYQLLLNLNGDSALAIAQAVNGNPTLLENILENTDGQVMANIVNNNPGFLKNLVGALDAGALATALNNALATAGGKAFISDLLSNLNPEMVAAAVNANPAVNQAFMTQAGANGFGTTLANVLNASNNSLITTLLNNLQTQPMVDILNLSMSIHASDLPNPGYNMLECFWFFAEWRMYAIIGWMYTRSWTRLMRVGENASYPPFEYH